VGHPRLSTEGDDAASSGALTCICLAMAETISRDELKQKIERNEHFTLVEALAPDKYAHAHLPGAINVPVDRVRELAPSMLPDKNAEIVLYCASPT